ncbi:MAG: ABC transporter permease [Nitrospirae bacterium]|nr:ABC transporter permease [Nitrospirota bacterium]
MLKLLKIWSFSHFKILKGNTLVTLLGIAFGVAIFTAIQIANQNIRDSFKWTIDQVAGKSRLEITGPDSGFSEEKIVKVREFPGVKEALPMIFQSVSVQDPITKGEEEVVVLGVDLLQQSQFPDFTIVQDEHPEFLPGMTGLLEPNSILISSFLAEHFHLRSGSVFSFTSGHKTIHTHVAGIIQEPHDLPPLYGGFFAMMDIASSQVLFNKLGKLDRIGLLVEENEPLEPLIKEIEHTLPGLMVQSPEQKNSMVDSMLGSFNLNLKALSEISILVGMFLIYNTLSLLVVRRKVEIGILRSVGLSGREVLRLVLLEALILGAIGSLIGIGLGFLISKWILKAVSLTVTSLYLKVFTQTVSFPLAAGLESLLTGIGVSLIAALIPAWEASRFLPRENLIRRGEVKNPHLSGGLALTGLFCFMVSSVLVFFPPIHPLPLFGYLAAIFLLMGLSLMTPACMFILSRFLTAPIFRNRFVFFKMAGSGFFKQPARNSISIAALMMSVSLLISVTLMIHSFRKTVDLWIDQTIKADFVIEPSGWLNPGTLSLVTPDLEEKIKKIEGIAGVDLYREDHLLYGNDPYLLNSRKLSIHQQYSRYLFTEGDSSEILKEAIDRNEILISERFSLEHHLRKGDSVTLNTPTGPASFQIGGIFYDYTTQGGKVVIDRSLYLKYWNDPLVNVLAVYLSKESIDQRRGEAIRREVEEALQKKDLLVISNQEIKSKVMAIFDQTFAITRVLEWITIFISLLGIINTLLANLLEQKREIGILRSMGATRNQIGILTLCETGWITLLGNLLGAVGGLALSLILIFVINKQSFFWSIQFDFSGMIFLRTFAIVTLTAILAGYFPARNAAGGNISEAVHYE